MYAGGGEGNLCAELREREPGIKALWTGWEGETKRRGVMSCNDEDDDGGGEACVLQGRVTSVVGISTARWRSRRLKPEPGCAGRARSCARGRP